MTAEPSPSVEDIKIAAIKELHTQGMGLKEAKDLVDSTFGTPMWESLVLGRIDD